jgi:hypothetical protein
MNAHKQCIEVLHQLGLRLSMHTSASHSLALQAESLHREQQGIGSHGRGLMVAAKCDPPSDFHVFRDFPDFPGFPDFPKGFLF